VNNKPLSSTCLAAL